MALCLGLSGAETVVNSWHLARARCHGSACTRMLHAVLHSTLLMTSSVRALKFIYDSNNY